MIIFDNVSKYYPTKSGRKYVLKDVSLELPTDKSIALLGPNGAGKSTLIKLISGADAPNRGKITSDKRISWPLGLSVGLQGSMTGRENVRFVARINGYRQTHIIESFVEEFAEIGRYYDEPIKTYSSGMRSRVSFGLSMAFDFDVLLIDEITSVGDQRFKDKSKKLLAEKREKSKVIMVSHDTKTLQEFCDIGIVVKEQNLTVHSTVDDAIKDYRETYV